VQFLGNDLRKRRADALAHLGLPQRALQVLTDPAREREVEFPAKTLKSRAVGMGELWLFT
jgi:hypothetical protein